ncbi:chaperonin [Triplophysa rosa]|uniref:Chaperonin n=1 Tax=Triplophysa rosa TaxID=992332 RepID=A0A9W7WUY5_TRIRA|nr:chaperonin [Triplophysa rosa]
MGLHRSITLNFLIAGHTKFAPDWCFGLLKRAFKSHVVPSQSVLEKVVHDSSTVNIAQVVGREDGTTEVPVCDWHTFFAESCKPVLGIKRFDPGMVFVKKEAGSDELPFQMLLQGMDFPDGEPVILTPPGLSLQRQQYLYKNIRPFVDDPYKDTVCPRPEVLPFNDSDKSAGEIDIVMNLVLEQNKDAELGHARGRGCGQPPRDRSRSPH